MHVGTFGPDPAALQRKVREPQATSRPRTGLNLHGPRAPTKVRYSSARAARSRKTGVGERILPFLTGKSLHHWTAKEGLSKGFELYVHTAASSVDSAERCQDVRAFS